ncbi:MAG: AAA family ATPase [Clostridia bacterium]|nr:AAA family ATPase [Clostridia bacterium]
MPKLYVITGPAGVGKSTISKELAKRSQKSVLIEGDDIYAQVVGGYVSPWKEGNHLEVFWKVCVNMIKTYLEHGYDVVFNYIVGTKDIETIKQELKEYEIKFVVLLTDEKTLLKRDAERPEDCQMKERCIVLLNSFKEKGYDENNMLDTTNLTVEEVVDKVENEERYRVKSEK